MARRKQQTEEPILYEGGLVSTQHDTAETRAAMNKMQHEKHMKRWKIWERVMRHGGMIICSSWGAAINERQAMYATRALAQKAYGSTPFDDLVIRLKKGDHRLEVGYAKSNITEVIPYTEGEVINDQYVVAREPDNSAKTFKHKTTCTRCHNPLAHGEHGEGKCETGRAPITPHDLI